MEGFEDIVLPELNPEEKRAARELAGVFNTTPEGKYLKNYQIQDILKSWNYPSMGAARIRKLIHYIRVKGFTIGLVATSKGYTRTSNPEELKKYQNSLVHRAATIMNLVDANKRDINFITSQNG